MLTGLLTLFAFVVSTVNDILLQQQSDKWLGAIGH